MFRYRNEAEFSRRVVDTARKAGWFVQRIETGAIGRGVPDIYAIAPGGKAVWLELKRIHGRLGRTNVIPWRPGQQAWLHEVTRRKQLAFTLACFDDAIVQIAHDRIWTHNTVLYGCYTIHYDITSLFK